MTTKNYKVDDLVKIRRFGGRFWCQIQEIKSGTIIAIIDNGLLNSYVKYNDILYIVINNLPFFFSIKMDSENMERLLTKKININITKYNNRFIMILNTMTKKNAQMLIIFLLPFLKEDMRLKN
jgi:hypothetical protein